MLDELTIDSMVVGSPAYKSKQLLAGDVIKKIDGQEVTLETLDDALRGCDLPGSAIVISVERQGISGTKDVVLKRLAREALADHVRIFELFTKQGKFYLELMIRGMPTPPTVDAQRPCASVFSNVGRTGLSLVLSRAGTMSC